MASLWDPKPEAPLRFMSQDECRVLGERVSVVARGGGLTVLNIESRWIGSARWARNAIHTAIDSEETTVMLRRLVRGAQGMATVNAFTDTNLRDAMARAEEGVKWWPEDADQSPVPFEDPPQVNHPLTKPAIWFDTTYNLNPGAREAAIAPLIDAARGAGLRSAGNLQVAAQGTSYVRDIRNPVLRYYPNTLAQLSLTVRDPRGVGSGWAGIDHNDWTKIDVATLGKIALDKCVASRNPVAVEPGRFTAILEPQAVCDLVMSIIGSLDRQGAEMGMGPFASSRPGYSKIGERVLDERITMGVDPMDPECGFVPFDGQGEPYRAVNWIERGVLRELSYSREYALINMRRDFALSNPGALRMSGGATTIDEMIASTDRGILVTRLSGIMVLDPKSLLTHGETRDGLWLIEKGKIVKPIKNFRVAESPLFALNKVQQLGTPQRVFHPSAPVIVPPVKVLDFNCPGLMDAV